VPPRRAPAVAAWVVPALVALVVATVGAAAAIAATHNQTKTGARSIAALSPLQPLPQPPAPSAPKTGKNTTTQKLIFWPSTNGYTIVLASLPLSSGANAARNKAFFALRKGLRQVGILVSSSYPSLQPGYYVVFSGVYPTLADAQSSLDTAKASFPGAYARPVAR